MLLLQVQYDDRLSDAGTSCKGIDRSQKQTIRRFCERGFVFGILFLQVRVA